MRCPWCNWPKTSVKDSRTTEDARYIRRRRECPKCKRRCSTYESAVNGENLSYLMMNMSQEEKRVVHGFIRFVSEGGLNHGATERPVALPPQPLLPPHETTDGSGGK